MLDDYPARDLPLLGSTIASHYVLDRVLGEGGMGVVFAARHLHLGETVAIKVLRPAAADDAEGVERFCREAQAAVRIKNEHVVRVLDVGPGDEHRLPYLVMEYLEGSDLAALLRKRRLLEVSEAVDYMLQASEAIAEAHTLGIVHRDLKPSNLVLTTGPGGLPLVKVLDFGVSKIFEHDGTPVPGLTATRALLGSPAYMSPEQVRSAKNVDQRADVWAIGAVLFELLSGQLPFQGQSPSAVLAAVAADPPIPLRKVCPDAPWELEQVLAACLVKDRDRRVPSVAALATMLAPFASPRGRGSVETIQRLGRRPSAYGPPPAPAGAFSPYGPPPPLLGAGSGSIPVPFAPPPPVRRSSAPVLVMIGSVVMLAMLLAGVWVRARAKKPAASASVSAVVSSGAPEHPPPGSVATAPSAPTATGSTTAAPGGSSTPPTTSAPRAARGTRSKGASTSERSPHGPDAGSRL